jgi:hypothetical protein
VFFKVYWSLHSITSPTTRQPFHLSAASSELAMPIELKNENNGKQFPAHSKCQRLIEGF